MQRKLGGNPGPGPAPAQHQLRAVQTEDRGRAWCPGVPIIGTGKSKAHSELPNQPTISRPLRSSLVLVGGEECGVRNSGVGSHNPLSGLEFRGEPAREDQTTAAQNSQLVFLDSVSFSGADGHAGQRQESEREPSRNRAFSWAHGPVPWGASLSRLTAPPCSPDIDYN